MRINITLIALTCGVMSQSGPVAAAVTSQQTMHLNGLVSRHFTLAGDRRSLGPMTYQNWRDQLQARSMQNADDRAWALTNVTPVVEGPWGSIASKKIFYFGINTAGERVKLPEVSDLWRWKPVGIETAVSKGVHDTYYVVPSGPDVVVPIQLGPLMPGILMERPTGSQPIQTTGLIDGKDFYFRERDGFWSLSIGGADVIATPDWYYAEGDYTLDVPNNEAVYDFIAKVAALYRGGIPTMANESRQ